MPITPDGSFISRPVSKYSRRLILSCVRCPFRPYLDNKVFWGRLGDGNPTELLLAAVREGGLESVLDEHFWLAQGQTGAANLLEDLGSALHASLGWFTFRGIPTSSQLIRLSELAGHPAQGRRYCRPGDLDRSSGSLAVIMTPRCRRL